MERLSKSKFRGNLIRKTRKELGMTQVEAGKLLGVSDATMVAWEKGGPMTLDRAMTLSSTFSLPLTKLGVSKEAAKQRQAKAKPKRKANKAETAEPAQPAQETAHGPLNGSTEEFLAHVRQLERLLLDAEKPCEALTKFLQTELADPELAKDLTAIRLPADLKPTIRTYALLQEAVRSAR